MFFNQLLKINIGIKLQHNSDGSETFWSKKNFFIENQGIFCPKIKSVCNTPSHRLCTRIDHRLLVLQNTIKGCNSIYETGGRNFTSGNLSFHFDGMAATSMCLLIFHTNIFLNELEGKF